MNVSIRRDRRGGTWPRRLTAGLCAAGLATQLACFSYQAPQEVVPASGSDVSLQLNDRGRVLVGGQLGESVLEVQGRIVASTDSAVTLSVARTVLMQGSTAVWTGEQVAIPREGVRSFRLRHYEKGRTVMLVVAVVTGMILVGTAISLVAGGNGRPDGGNCPSPPCGNQQ